LKRYFCTCGQEIFPNNLFCEKCGRDLIFDPKSQTMWGGVCSPEGFTAHISQTPLQDPVVFKACSNRHSTVRCNWAVTQAGQSQCISCSSTRTIPNLDNEKNQKRWFELEKAKRQLFTTLLNLNLPIQNFHQKINGLAFDFLEDKRSNPNIAIEHVLSGHCDGVITVNAMEADDDFLHMMKEQMGEYYRTLLGHFRHEIGHYYWDIVIHTPQHLSTFRELFGDERADYDTALKHYYEKEQPKFRSHNYISRYASSHPHEDWAETWAHYLHIVDTLETAVSYGISAYEPKTNDFDDWYSEWARVAQTMNALNRSMGLSDAYPFMITYSVSSKLKFIDQLIDEFSDAGSSNHCNF